VQAIAANNSMIISQALFTLPGITGRRSLWILDGLSILDAKTLSLASIQAVLPVVVPCNALCSQGLLEKPNLRQD
jgi:hypothetical protein